MGSVCHGNAEDHCCYLGAAGVCRFLEENTVPGRRWACGLYRELGSWERMHASHRYRTKTRPLIDASLIGVDCGDWPQPGNTCTICGVNGDG